jgi:aminopeptidase N
VNDEPTDKASYRVAVTVEKPYTAISNGVLASVADLGARRRFVWEQKEPMASYRAIVDVGRWRLQRLNTGEGEVPIRLYTTARTPPETVAAFARRPRCWSCSSGSPGPTRSAPTARS